MNDSKSKRHPERNAMESNGSKDIRFRYSDYRSRLSTSVAVTVWLLFLDTFIDI